MVSPVPVAQQRTKWSIWNHSPLPCKLASIPPEPGSGIYTARTRNLSARLPATQSLAYNIGCSVAFATGLTCFRPKQLTFEQGRRKCSQADRLLATHRLVGRYWGRRIDAAGFLMLWFRRRQPKSQRRWWWLWSIHLQPSRRMYRPLDGLWQ